jgi:hypothetical protein
MEQKHKQLLFILLTLTFIKFVLVPVYEWQNITIAENNSNNLRLVKSTLVIEQLENTQSSVNTMREKKIALQTLFFKHENDNTFQLEQQQWLEKTFESNNLEVRNIGWSVPLPIKEWQLVQHGVQVNFSGNIIDLTKVKRLFESQKKWLEISSFNFRFDKKRPERLQETSGRITLNFYMRGAE